MIQTLVTLVLFNECYCNYSSSLTEWHVVQVDAWGPGNIADDTAFHCQTIRRNPAKIGAVTGSATYASFLSSVIGEC